MSAYISGKTHHPSPLANSVPLRPAIRWSSCLLQVAQRRLSPVSIFALVLESGSICGMRPSDRSAIRPSSLQLPRAGQRVD